MEIFTDEIGLSARTAQIRASVSPRAVRPSERLLLQARPLSLIHKPIAGSPMNLVRDRPPTGSRSAECLTGDRPHRRTESHQPQQSQLHQPENKIQRGTSFSYRSGPWPKTCRTHSVLIVLTQSDALRGQYPAGSRRRSCPCQ